MACAGPIGPAGCARLTVVRLGPEAVPAAAVAPHAVPAAEAVPAATVMGPCEQNTMGACILSYDAPPPAKIDLAGRSFRALPHSGFVGCGRPSRG